MFEACKYYGIDCIEPTNVDKQNGHPNQAGMLSIANQLFDLIKDN